jgi:CheY-like chemotaxis protein
MALPKHDSRRVLVIDRNSLKLSLRATVLRNYEVEVHTASSLEEAPILWTTNFYDLIMVAAQENWQEAAEVSEQIWRCNPRQRVALLEGAPKYVRELTPAPAGMAGSTPGRPGRVGLEPVPRSQWQETVQWLFTLVHTDGQQFA